VTYPALYILLSKISQEDEFHKDKTVKKRIVDREVLQFDPFRPINEGK
jgi:hypothetical protein